MQIGCIVMAAGNAARFGKNKLLAEYQGKSLIRRAMEAASAPGLSAVAVVTQYDEIAALAREFGFAAIRNDAPERGISNSIRLGTEALADHCDGILYQVADQPLLRQETVSKLIEAFCAHPDRIIVPVAGERPGNPCLFPAVFFPQLAALSGDRGGSQIIKKHPEQVFPVEVPPEELFDVDTAETLQRIQNLSF